MPCKSPGLALMVILGKSFSRLLQHPAFMRVCRFVVSLFLALAALDSGALATDILTNRGDNGRTGLNSTESILTPASVQSSSFGLLYNNPVDGEVYAQPLYVSNQQITPTGGQTKVANVLYVATEHDSLYAFDADTGTQYWKVSLLPTGESPVQANDPNINCTDLIPEIGITATPVIDRASGTNGTLFVLSFSTNGTNYFHRLHAIDLSTGQDRTGLGPVVIAASVTGAGPATTFIAQKQRDRPGLLLLNGIIYTAWSSFCDNPSYSGWIIAYHESNLSLAAVLNVDPNGKPPSSDLPDGSGNGIWQSGNGPAVDSSGNIYVATGNGPFDTNLTGGFPTNQDYGDTVLKLSPSLSSLITSPLSTNLGRLQPTTISAREALWSCRTSSIQTVQVITCSYKQVRTLNSTFWIATTWGSSTRPTTVRSTRSCEEPFPMESGRHLHTFGTPMGTSLSIMGATATSRSCSLNLISVIRANPNSAPARRLPRLTSISRDRRRRSLLTAPATGFFGPAKIINMPRPKPSYTPGMPRTWQMSFTIAAI